MTIKLFREIIHQSQNTFSFLQYSSAEIGGFGGMQIQCSNCSFLPSLSSLPMLCIQAAL